MAEMRQKKDATSSTENQIVWHSETVTVGTKECEQYLLPLDKLYTKADGNSREMGEKVEDSPMDNIFITLNEGAKLEGIAYYTFYRRISRMTDIEVIEKDNPKGGKPIKKIPLSALSDVAIKRYRKRLEQKGNAKKERMKILGMRIDKNNPPWYVGYDYSAYKEQYPDKLQEAIRRYKYIEEKRQYSSNVQEAKKAIAYKYGVTVKSLERWENDVKKAESWAYLMEYETGRNYEYYKVMCLCRKPSKAKGNMWSLDPRVKVIIENELMKNVTNKMKDAMLYKLVKKEADRQQLPVPSNITVHRYLKNIRRMYAQSLRLKAEGKKVYTNKCSIKAQRDSQGLMVNELVMGDAHVFDFFVEYEGRAIRPILVAWIDVRSRCIVGWAITTTATANVIKASLRHLVLPKKDEPFEGVPKVIFIDNGMEYTAEKLLGRNRKIRTQLDNEIDEVINGFYYELGIKKEKRAQPYQAWEKSYIERFFRTVVEQFSKCINSYVGSLTTSKTADKVDKDIKGMLERGELPHFIEAVEGFKNYLKDYHDTKHSGLKTEKLGRTPLQVYENAEIGTERYYRAAPAIGVLDNYMLEVKEAKVSTSGIKFMHNYYQCQELTHYFEQKVKIRYDLTDLSKVKVYTLDSTLIGIAEKVQKLGFYTENEEDMKPFIEAAKMKKRQYRGVKDAMGYLEMTFEERQALLGAEAVPETLTGDISVQKVISIMNQQKEIKNKKIEETKAKEKQAQTDADNYYINKGADVLDKLNIG
ncbi:Mu transposase C-terminal domain-containing protein [Vallitalea guaymasensis]|uniref:Mu transposase C-terminal domain-containing protein n=1 Tax=Vallitalea guaymasensis TaxID=1185412 RepID=UPI001FA83BAB|nr:Mu transposase C-terminal domain-containing protein [Vallitalea guaymasensis]